MKTNLCSDITVNEKESRKDKTEEMMKKGSNKKAIIRPQNHKITFAISENINTNVDECCIIF